MKDITIGPTQNRKVSLDIFRGVAVLGILLMNIQSYANPSAAYLNPTAYGNFDGINYWLWYFTHLLADMKFMSIFSILFGAGIILFSEKSERKGTNTTLLYYRRNFWLLIFGLLHAHLIWYGDVLYSYAICAFFAFWLRDFNVRRLLISAFIFLMIGSLYNIFIGLSIPHLPAEAIQQIEQFWQPGIAHLNLEIKTYQSSYLEQMPVRSSQALLLETEVFISLFIWRVMGMMCIGMACYKAKFLSATRSTKFYTLLSLSSLLMGYTIIILGVNQNLAHQFSMEFSFFIGSQYNYWGSIFVAIGYISLLSLWIKSNFLASLKRYLAKVGQMAFTNYIFQSIIITFIFYGHGFALFAQLSRWQCLVLVIVMWGLHLIGSKIWLNYFQFGPLEWAWRCLTYAKLQSLKVSAR